MTTFLPEASAIWVLAARPPAARMEASAATAISRITRNGRWTDALWAPSWETGNALASSPPEHRAWGAVTVGHAAGGQEEREMPSRGTRGMGATGVRSDRRAGRRDRSEDRR